MTAPASIMSAALEERRIGRIAVVDLAPAPADSVTAAGSRSVATNGNRCRSSMSQTICPTRPWPMTMARPFSPGGGTAVSSGPSTLECSSRGVSRRATEASTGISAMVMEVTASVKLPAPRRHQAVARRHADDHEGELAARTQQQTRLDRRCPTHAEQARQADDERSLDGDQADHRGKQPERLPRQLAEIDVHADGEEEQAEQQPLERLDGSLDRLAELGFRQQQAGDERARAPSTVLPDRRRPRCRRSRTGWRRRTARWTPWRRRAGSSGAAAGGPTTTITADGQRRIGHRQHEPGHDRAALAVAEDGDEQQDRHDRHILRPAGSRSWCGRPSSTGGAGWRGPR